MGELLFVSLIWAFSFGLIKDNLAGVDSNFVSLVRLLIPTLLFLPFLRLRKLPLRVAWRLALIGAVQYGVMYVAYIAAFRYLEAYEVALFTIFTPIYVTLIYDATQRRFSGLNLSTAVLAVVGTGIVVEASLGQSGLVLGFLLMQASNLCFAYGQVRYKALMREAPEVKDQQVFGLLYAGGVAATLLATLAFTDLPALKVSGAQWLSLLYLGAIASGLGFFLWNHAARRVRIGTLAVFNDLKIPLSIAVSLLFFGEQADVLHLAAGGALVVAALWLNEAGARGVLRGFTQRRGGAKGF